MVTGVMSDPASQFGAAPAAVRKIRVVLADDSSPVLTALGCLLRKFLSVEIAGQTANGLEAFALAAELRPDLVITDLNLPGIAGLRLVGLLRCNYPTIKSVVTSTHDGPTLRAATLRHGADAFIHKQRLADELPDLLTRLFPDAAQAAIPVSKP